jgi:hypothetical protein
MNESDRGVPASPENWHPNESVEEKLADGHLLAVDLDYDTVRTLKQSLEQEFGLTLKDRGDAHLTLIRPAAQMLLKEGKVGVDQLKILRTLVGQDIAVEGIGTVPNNLSKAEIAEYLRKEQEDARDDPEKRAKGVTYFAVIKLPTEVLALLNELNQQYNDTTEDPSKKLGKYHPHVTIGFTHGDRFDAPKVVNPNVSVEVPRMRYGSLSVQRSRKDELGNVLKDERGFSVNYYDAL